MIDLSEMSEWDGSQAPPNLTLERAPVAPPTRAYKPGELCFMGRCAGCGKTLISAVPVRYTRVSYVKETKARPMVDVLHCGDCYEWPKP